MALRQRVVEELRDRENYKVPNGKQGLPLKGTMNIKRAALGEVGNKLDLQSHNNAGIKKKTDMCTNQLVNPRKDIDFKEPSANIAARKENVFKKNDKPTTSSKATFKRQESIIKNIPKPTAENTLLGMGDIKSYSSKQLVIVDPDEGSRNEPQMVTEYINDIYNYLRELEIQFPIEEQHLSEHKSTPRMRAILINWLVEVHMNFKFCLETLHMCVSIVDRYLQTNKLVGRDTLQLVGTSAMLIASKYEEMYLPELDDFVYICDDTFSKKQILQMEGEILKKIEFNLGRPLSVHFLRRYSKIAQVRPDQHTLAKYLLELALQEYEMSHIKPSLQAAAACCLSISVLSDYVVPSKAWTPTLVHYTTYKYSDFESVLTDMAHLLVKAETSKYQAIRKKYSTSAFAKISLNMKLRGTLIRKLTGVLIPK